MRKESPRSESRVADAVRAELARARRSQTDAAAALSITQSAFNRRATGEVEFTASEIRDLAAWLGVPVAALLGPEAVTA